MEHILDLYRQEADPERPLICFDEKPMQITGSTREEVSMKPGKPKRVDYEYERHGTQNLFMFFAPFQGWRHVGVRPRRRKVDFAEEIRSILETYFPEAEKIRLVCDNLNTHVAGSFYERYEPETARKLARTVDFHYTPTNGSWLNIAEIELAAFKKQCSLREGVPWPSVRGGRGTERGNCRPRSRTQRARSGRRLAACDRRRSHQTETPIPIN